MGNSLRKNWDWDVYGVPLVYLCINAFCVFLLFVFFLFFLPLLRCESVCDGGFLLFSRLRF